MRPEDIKKRVKAEPFRPFRVHISNGSSYDVRHPEMIYVSNIEVVIATEWGDNDLADETVYCSPLHITHLELLNGSKPKRKSKRGR